MGAVAASLPWPSLVKVGGTFAHSSASAAGVGMVSGSVAGRVASGSAGGGPVTSGASGVCATVSFGSASWGGVTSGAAAAPKLVEPFPFPGA